MSCIDNPIVELKTGEMVYITNQQELENCLTRTLGSDIVSRMRDIDYDNEREQICSDLECYESELDGYHDLILDIVDRLELIKSAKTSKCRNSYIDELLLNLNNYI